MRTRFVRHQAPDAEFPRPAAPRKLLLQLVSWQSACLGCVYKGRLEPEASRQLVDGRIFGREFEGGRERVVERRDAGRSGGGRYRLERVSARGCGGLR